MIYQGYRFYTISKSRAKQTIVWQCSRSKLKQEKASQTSISLCSVKCKCTVVTYQDKVVEIRGVHNHPPPEPRISKKRQNTSSDSPLKRIKSSKDKSKSLTNMKTQELSAVSLETSSDQVDNFEVVEEEVVTEEFPPQIVEVDGTSDWNSFNFIINAGNYPKNIEFVNKQAEFSS